uniref:Reverse transcriptase domain-containing protein n=1 Tax=Davidia involucrata TaxID=16924 RepID=A0A5B7BB47_DAVIN
MLDQEIKEALIRFLEQNKEVFAWTVHDMKGIDPGVITHRLMVDPLFPPVRQKRRPFAPDRVKVINEEVQRLLEARMIREVHYPDWVANPVLAPKKNGKWRVCVDFTDLNKACPKDSFPVPRIDQLVDATAGHQLLTFMDAYSGYNQIQMYQSDQEKTSFITDRGLYCYQVMPFGLKNAGATYQRLVNKMFQRQIGETMEVYIDDMLVKSLRAEDHITHLSETFTILRQHKMKLNPSKCLFGVTAGKFLGFLVSQRGIEADPKQIQALLDMKSPRNKKEVQSLNGRVAALKRFISRSSDKCFPFFKALKGDKTFEWTPQCEEAFAQLKSYLGSPELLSKPTQGEDLYLYLAVSAHSVSSALIREEAGIQKPIFYTSKTLVGAELRYPDLEKLAFALLVSSRKLRPYFQAHTIIVPTSHPLRSILHKPETSGRLIKWSVELGQFDIRYVPRTAIRAQALADFIAEFSRRDAEEDRAPTGEQALPENKGEAPEKELFWILHSDGASNLKGSGAGITLQNPEGSVIERAIAFGFKASNNEAEYEALIIGLQMAQLCGVERLKAYSDSQLVVSQVTQEYEARDSRMYQYTEVVNRLRKGFLDFSISRIARTENIRADFLATQASQQTTSGSVIKVGFQERSSIYKCSVPRQICPILQTQTWMDPIICYLKDGTLPEEKVQARKIKLKSARYVIISDQLYRRSYSQPLLRCLTPEEASYVLREIHEGICGNHLGGRTLAHRAMTQGYYWPYMQKRCSGICEEV